MKLLFTLATIFFLNLANAQEAIAASCCSGESTTGKCSGTSSCTACSNCKYCGHCAKGGGTCGVCAPAPKPVKETRSSAVKSHLPGDKLIVASETLNVRSGAGTDYDVVETLADGEALTYLSQQGDWFEVRVVKSGKRGYVNSKFVRK